MLTSSETEREPKTETQEPELLDLIRQMLVDMQRS